VNHIPVFAALTPSGQGGGATMIFLIQMLAIFAIFWFLIIRPQRQQQKRHEQLLKSLKKGDEIVTAGGVVGEVIHLKDDRVTIRSGESKLVIERERVARVIAPKSAEEATAK
jgi:preprotein translocase subunit YajC